MSERLAHVSYVLTDQELLTNRGIDFAFLAQPFSHATNLILMAGSIALLGILVMIGRKIPAVRDRIRFFRGRARSYQEFIPLILRFCLGAVLIAAASQQTLISPAVHNQPGLAVIQLVLGFLIMTGFMLTPAVITTLVLSVGALIIYPTLADNLEIIAVTLAILLLGKTKPGIDDLLGIPMITFPDRVQRIIPLILRLGLGGAMLVMAVGDKLLNPHLFGAVVEIYGLAALIPVSTAMWVTSATLIELTFGLAILIGFQTRLVSLLTFAVLGLFFFGFGEQIAAHVTLFAGLFVLIITGGGHWSLDDLYAKRRHA